MVTFDNDEQVAKKRCMTPVTDSTDDEGMVDYTIFFLKMLHIIILFTLILKKTIQ